MALLLFTLTSCVQRSIQIDSMPRVALVVLDEVKMGYTPLTIPFSHYGVREIRLEKPGFAKLNVVKNIKKPWYETPILAFFVDVLWPFVIEDVHPFQFTLESLSEEKEKGLLDRADEARSVLKGNTGS